MRRQMQLVALIFHTEPLVIQCKVRQCVAAILQSFSFRSTETVQVSPKMRERIRETLPGSRQTEFWIDYDRRLPVIPGIVPIEI
jgi:hypothetical protein